MRPRVILLLFFCVSFLHGQGIYTDFGQNSVQGRKPAYSLRQDQIEIIYFADGEELARNALAQVQEFIPEYENRLNYNLSNGIRIIIYNHYEDYKQSNLVITDPQHYAGGYSTLNENVASAYFEGSQPAFRLQLRKAVAEVIINEFIFGGNIRERIQTAALLTLPDWYYKGLVAYLAESWNISNDNFLKDFFQNNKQRSFTSLRNEDEILAGHSIWRYLEEKNGRGAVSNIVFLTRIGRSVENAVIYYTGLNIHGLLRDWQEFYLEKYKMDELSFKYPRGQENAPSKLARKKHTQFRIDPTGKRIALVTNTNGRYHIVLHEVGGKKVEIIDRGGHQLLNRNHDEHYPLLAWNPADHTLSVVIWEKESTVIKRFSSDGKLQSREILPEIPFVRGFSYSPDGKKIIFSVLHRGCSDLLLYHTGNQKAVYLTEDKFDQLSPRFSIDGRSVFYISNRLEGGSASSSYYAVYRMQTDSGDQREEYITGRQRDQINAYDPAEALNSVVSYLSDDNGIVNNYFFDMNNRQTYQLTNYKRCILHNDIAASAPVVGDLLYFNNRYRIYIGVIAEDFKNEAISDAAKTAYRKWLDKESRSDTFTENKPVTEKPKTDSGSVLVQKRVFISGFEEKETTEPGTDHNELKTDPMFSLTRPSFGIDYFLQIFDKSILSNPLFPAGVNEKIYNYPLLSPHFQTRISDVEKNHVITAGLRIPIRIKASDYYLIYNNRRGRWDKEFRVFRRSRILDDPFVPQKMISSRADIILQYPFNERSRLDFSFFSRDDRVMTMAVDSAELRRAVRQNIYFGNGIEYVFDNVRSNGLNLFQGMRFKIYNENYHRQGGYQFISNNGIDFRLYQKLHRQIYLAVRLSGAASFGTQSTAYYLGGVENQLVSVDTNRNFNYSIPTLRGSDFAFQTLATPMRGFLRNTRAGNKFVLLNAEIRVPLFAYLIQKPISSEFFRSIMIMGFFDAGSAWQGRSPYSIENPFNTRLVSSPQYTITVVSQRDPFIYAFGVGARAKILGHYIKWETGWGLIESKFQVPMSTFSVGLDF